VTFKGINDRSGAESFRNIEAIAHAPPVLEDAEYWLDDLVGLEVFDLEGQMLGTVSGVLAGVAQTRLVVQGPVGFQIPFVAELVPEVDLDRRRVVIDPPPGLISEEV